MASPFGSHLSPGGSSGGSAALVAALGVPVGLTADIGGSTRIPALLNGLRRGVSGAAFGAGGLVGLTVCFF